MVHRDSFFWRSDDYGFLLTLQVLCPVRLLGKPCCAGEHVCLRIVVKKGSVVSLRIPNFLSQFKHPQIVSFVIRICTSSGQQLALSELMIHSVPDLSAVRKNEKTTASRTSWKLAFQGMLFYLFSLKSCFSCGTLACAAIRRSGVEPVASWSSNKFQSSETSWHVGHI